MEAKTVDSLSSQNVNLICSERDKMKLGGITNRHPLLFHFNRSLWPVLFATVQLKGLLPMNYSFDNKRHLARFKLLLATKEDEVLSFKLLEEYMTQLVK